MSQITIPSPGHRPIDELQRVVQSEETLNGRLVNISVKGTDNMLVFTGVESEDDIPKLDKRSLLVVIDVDHPPPRTGFKLVCFGPTLVAGKQQPVAAYRSD